MPDAAIGADVMVGFPGETDADFEESRRFIEAMPFTYLHVFTYSERPGTPAATEPGASRCRCAKSATEFCGSWRRRGTWNSASTMVGQTLSAVTLHEQDRALTGNYLTVELAKAREANRLITIHIGRVSDAGLQETSELPVQNYL